jgi:hypothetical protein
MKLGLTDKQYNNLLSLLQEQAEPPASEPEAGTSSKQAGGQGYPQVGKWESGVTRGPGNQVGVTKWADVVGAKLNRGKANPLKEIKYTKRSLLRLMSEQTPISDKDTPGVKVGDVNTSGFLGAEQPSEPIPAIQKYPNQCQYYEYGRCPFEMKNREGEIYFWHYHSVAPVGFWTYVGELHGEVPGLGDYKLGNYNSNDFVGNKKDMMDYYENELDWWLKENMDTTLEQWKRYQNRLSKSGKEVPKGFDPDRYDEYLAKIGPIQQQIDTIEKKHKSNWNILKPNFGPGGYWNQKELNYYNNLKQQLTNITNEYSNNEFSYGITNEELEQYNQRKKEITVEYEKEVNEIKGKYGSYDLDRADNTRTYNQTAYAELPPENNTLKQQRDQELYQLQQKYQKNLMELDVVFGKDDFGKDVSMFGQSFDKFWDKWGGAIQTVGNIAVIALSGGIAGMVEGVVGAVGFTFTSGVLRAIAPYAVDATFNALVGTYQASRGKNENAVISFLCAMIPFISYGRNVGKVSIEVAEGLSKKVAVGKFDTKESMEIFIKALTPEERYIFRDVMTLPKESIKANFDKAVKELSKKMAGNGVKVAKAGTAVWLPKILKQLGFEAVPPTAAMITNGFLKVIKDSGHAYTQDELIRIKQTLKNIEKEGLAKQLMIFGEASKILKETKVSSKNKPDLVNLLGAIQSKRQKEIPEQEAEKFFTEMAEIMKKGKN